MTGNALVMANRQRSGVDEGQSSRGCQARVQVMAQRKQSHRHQLDKPVVAHQIGKLRSQMDHHVLGVVRFEIPVMGLMKVNDNGHNLTQGQGRLRPPFGPTYTQLAP